MTLCQDPKMLLGVGSETRASSGTIVTPNLHDPSTITSVALRNPPIASAGSWAMLRCPSSKADQKIRFFSEMGTYLASPSLKRQVRCILKVIDLTQIYHSSLKKTNFKSLLISVFWELLKNKIYWVHLLLEIC